MQNHNEYNYIVDTVDIKRDIKREIKRMINSGELKTVDFMYKGNFTYMVSDSLCQMET